MNSVVQIIEPEGILKGCTIKVLISNARQRAITMASTFCLNLDFEYCDRF